MRRWQRRIGRSLTAVAALLAAQCSGGQGQSSAHAETEEEPVASASHDRPYNTFVCLVVGNPNPGTGPGNSMLINYPGIIVEPYPIEHAFDPYHIHDQYRSEDRQKIQLFYNRYTKISRGLRGSWIKRDIGQQREYFKSSMQLLTDWGNSGLRQKYCGSCSRAFPIRRVIANLPMEISLRFLYETNDVPEFKLMVSRYLTKYSSMDNVKDPINPTPPPVRNMSEDFPSVLSDNAYRALMAYYIMAGDDRSADAIWPMFNIAIYESHGNADYPLADDPDDFVKTMENTTDNPHIIVRKKWINPDNRKLCSGLYINYIEYLYLKRAFSPNKSRSEAIVRRYARSFLHDSDPRLLSPVGRDLLLRLTRPGRMRQ